MSRQGKRVRSGEKQILMNVRQFFEKEKHQGKSILRDRVIERTALATGLSQATVKRVSKEYQDLEKFETPKKRYCRTRVRVNLDDFDVRAIRREIHSFYTRKVYPNLTSLLKILRDKGVFQAGRSTLYKIVRLIGFRYKVRTDGKRYIYEQPRIIQQRHTYLRKVRKFRAEGRSLVYLDETWLNSHAAPERVWVDEADQSGGWRRPTGKGQRLIVLHAGSCEGWISGAELVFRSKKKSDDFHDEMNAKHFLEWFEKTLISRLPPKSVIVLDNAKYHNTVIEKIPTKSSLKKVMQDWLERHGIPYEPIDLKRDLLQKIQRAQVSTVYETDHIAKQYGHEVIRLPVAHCELNPIELAWAVVKDYCRKNNQLFTLKGIEALIPQGFQQCSPDKWKHFCEHVKQIEEDFWQKDGLLEEATDEFIIQLSDADSDSSSDEGDDSEDIESDDDDDEPEDEYDRAIQREEKRLFEILAKEPQFPMHKS